jgi:hypothetical protein
MQRRSVRDNRVHLLPKISSRVARSASRSPRK